MKGFSKFKGVSSASALAIGVAFGLVALVATPAAAVETTATLQGKVADAPQGTKVTARNVENGAKATVAVRADGTYDVVGLRPGNYEVTFLAPDGNVLVQTITLSVGETSYLDGDMKEATKAVVVIGRRGSANIKSSEVSTSISRVQIDALPQQGRNFLSFATLAPGVSVSTNDERKTFQGGALNANAVNVFIDGISQKNQVLQGGVAGQDASRGNPFPQSAIKEYKVSTQNFKAEYEQSASAIITAVTKSGTNEHHGEAFVNYQSNDMIGVPYYSRPSHDKYENKEYGVELDGPIIKDKLFYMFTYEKREDTRPGDTVNVKNSADLVAINPAAANALATKYDGNYPKDFSQESYFGKLTWFINEVDSVDLTYRNRDESDIRGFNASTAYERGNNLDQYVREGSLQWKHRDNNFLNEASLDWQSAHWRNSPLTTGPGTQLVKPTNIIYDPNHPNDIRYATYDLYSYNPTLFSFGGLPYAQEKAQDSISFKNNMTFTGLNWHGDHIVKAGFKLAVYDYTAMESIPTTNPQLYYDAATYVVGGNNTPFAATIVDGDPTIKSKNTQVGLFVQDDWTVNQHLTFNLGIRWDWESNMFNNNFQTPADVATALRNLNGFNDVFNPEDYISNGSNRKSFKGAIQPRLGVSYDLNGDRETVFFAGYGRYYDRNIFDIVQLEQRRATLHNATIYFDSTTPWNSSYATDPSQLTSLAIAKNIKGEIIVLNNNQKVPYSDQFNLGVRQKFGKIQTSVTLSHTEARDLFNWVLGNRDPSLNGGWCQYGSQYACQPWGFGAPGYGAVIVSTNDRKARSTSLFITAEKAYSKEDKYGWTAKLDLNNAESTGHNDPFIFDYANASATGWHHAEDVEKWRFVGSAIVDGPWDTQLSGLLTLSSGTPFARIADVTVAPNTTALQIIDAYYFPKDKIGYKQLDLKIGKDFTLPNGNVFTVEGQAINVFDWVNHTYGGWTSGRDTGSGATRAGENNTTGPARSYQIGLKYKW
ncbi:TonB-dependent receptor [Pseudaquidulcibacter saccharophilus]|uniref:TonB-dependent receptor n=1 Tax=Pseudaquidulcibacter saccharophilus TaxID=2831900 RepID=UPI001EFF1B80|nr:carboxypeptidase regulatory-like domain-containing protein [Pseudaquidulcibacter saccharophilus]